MGGGVGWWAGVGHRGDGEGGGEGRRQHGGRA